MSRCLSYFRPLSFLVKFYGFQGFDVQEKKTNWCRIKKFLRNIHLYCVLAIFILVIKHNYELVVKLIQQRKNQNYLASAVRLLTQTVYHIASLSFFFNHSTRRKSALKALKKFKSFDSACSSYFETTIDHRKLCNLCYKLLIGPLAKFLIFLSLDRFVQHEGIYMNFIVVAASFYFFLPSLELSVYTFLHLNILLRLRVLHDEILKAQDKKLCSLLDFEMFGVLMKNILEVLRDIDDGFWINILLQLSEFCNFALFA